MLIYLNRTGFNGLFRLNGDGRFNVPAGRYARPRIFDPEHVFAISRILARRGLSIALAAFDRVVEEGAGGRLSLLRSALRAAVTDGAFHRLYRGAVHA